MKRRLLFHAAPTQLSIDSSAQVYKRVAPNGAFNPTARLFNKVRWSLGSLSV
jgi:hypothetical protein